MTRRHYPLWLLLAAALFMRAFVPQGYMPERSDSGAITVVVCGSGGTHLIPVADGTTPDSDRQKADPPCAFVGLGTPSVPSGGFDLAPPALVGPAYIEAHPGISPAVPPRLQPPARGPPLLA